MNCWCVRTDSGIEGFGMATSFTSVDPMIEAFKSGIGIGLTLSERALKKYGRRVL
jgi:hypothetical protein